MKDMLVKRFRELDKEIYHLKKVRNCINIVEDKRNVNSLEELEELVDDYDYSVFYLVNYVEDNKAEILYDIVHKYIEREYSCDNSYLEFLDSICSEFELAFNNIDLTNAKNEVAKIDILAEELREVDKELEHYRYEYLNVLYKRALKELKSQCYKYQRHGFISDYYLKHIELKIDHMRYGALGGFATIEDKNTEIIVNRDRLFDINNDLNPSMRTNKRQKQLNKEVLATLKHELVHAFSYYEYDLYEIGVHSCSDHCLINMNTLAFASDFKESNGYNTYTWFKETEYYNELKNKTFSEIETLNYRLFWLLDKKKRELSCIGHNAIKTQNFYDDKVLIGGIYYVWENKVRETTEIEIIDKVSTSDNTLVYFNVKLPTIFTFEDINAITLDTLKNVIRDNYNEIASSNYPICAKEC